MALVGKIEIVTSAQIGPLEKSLKRGAASVKHYSDTVNTRVASMTRVLSGWSAALFTAGTGGAMTMLMRRQMEVMDAAAKLSDRLGVSTESLVGLRHAAELTGASSEMLDAGLESMAKRLGEAARGTGRAQAALEELGLSADRLIRMAPNEAFYEIANALKTIEEPARRNAIAANLFSKANMKLLNTLSLGAEGLRGVQDEAERLGATFSRFDAAQIEAANDAITRMKTSLAGLGRIAAIEFAPIIHGAADAATQVDDATRRVGDFQKAIVGLKSIALKIAEWGARFQVAMHPLDTEQYQAELQAVLNAQKALERHVAEIELPPVRLPKAQVENLKRQARAGVAEAQRILWEAKTPWDEAGDSADALADSVETVTDRVRQLRDRAQELSSPFQDLARKWEADIATFAMSQREKQLFQVEQSLRLSTEVQEPTLPVPTAPASLPSTPFIASVPTPPAIPPRPTAPIHIPAGLDMPPLPDVGGLNVPAAFDMPGLPDIPGVNVPVGFSIDRTGLEAVEGLDGRQLELGVRFRPPSLAHLEALDAKLTELEQHAELMQFGERLTEQMRTPLENTRLEIERMQEALAEGAITPETMQRALEAKLESLKPSTIEPAGAAAMEQGTAAGFHAQTTTESRHDDEALQQRDDQIRLLEQLIEIIRGTGAQLADLRA